MLNGKLEWLGARDAPPAHGMEEDRASLSPSVRTSLFISYFPVSHVTIAICHYIYSISLWDCDPVLC